jgi:gas vesicle protein
MNSGKIILSALAGATAGAVLGILFAPEKGEATRKSISHKTSEYADMLKGKIDSAGDRVNERIDLFQDKAIDWLERRKEKMHARTPEAHKGNNI